ncbi:hypothetical protein [Jiella pelagia]|uniref:Uncharacterized protein n=1 Tax=Jiella pelagia TaxID=2986949 RepID=A0ABY7BWL8_9HYPH|nr:hypothetical protein [Jiella pelagia]WAP68221.1 hypothetical protein OH818_23110 [Jiella pelagia]
MGPPPQNGQSVPSWRCFADAEAASAARWPLVAVASAPAVLGASGVAGRPCESCPAAASPSGAGTMMVPSAAGASCVAGVSCAKALRGEAARDRIVARAVAEPERVKRRVIVISCGALPAGWAVQRAVGMMVSPV